MFQKDKRSSLFSPSFNAQTNPKYYAEIFFSKNVYKEQTL
jgi:hypothetical protein